MTQELTLHATCVALDRQHGILITGASGSGKSSLALQLMGYGAKLVSDDRTIIRQKAGDIIATTPNTIKGQIEARGIGILNAAILADTVAVLQVDLDQTEDARLPPRRTVTHLGVTLPLLHKSESPHFAASVLQYAREGRSDI